LTDLQEDGRRAYAREKKEKKEEEELAIVKMGRKLESR
jgi:hypothetical protein